MWLLNHFLFSNYHNGLFVLIHLFSTNHYLGSVISKTMTMLWIYIEIKSLDESSIKLGNKSFWVLKKWLEKLDIKRI
jgi:hypothetical protein